MRSICILAATIAIVAAPPFTQLDRAQAQRALQASSYGAYGGKKRHTDPDPNVRFEMMRQRNWRKG
jgi:hypothetical protein